MLVAVDYTNKSEEAAKNALNLLLEDYDKQLEVLNDNFVKFVIDFTYKQKDKW
ncbi:MAG: hypothetical protein U0451_00090 [Candidatus Saccharimonadales bacterium]